MSTKPFDSSYNSRPLGYNIIAKSNVTNQICVTVTMEEQLQKKPYNHSTHTPTHQSVKLIWSSVTSYILSFQNKALTSAVTCQMNFVSVFVTKSF